MKKNSVIIIVLGFVLIVSGLLGIYTSKESTDNSWYEMNSSGMMDINQSGLNTNQNMMDTGSRFVVDKDSILIELDVLKASVENYLENYEEDLVISDIFIFEDSEYYFSIIEEDTGRGAMELLVNQYTGDIYPEFGPNMMWNYKYGMHNGNRMSGQGMMSGRNMMDYGNAAYSESNELNNEEAYDSGEKYLIKYLENFKLAEEYHEFYGYYTFHVEANGNVVGMLSVNAKTGEVWYHEWHGILTNVISVHEDDH